MTTMEKINFFIGGAICMGEFVVAVLFFNFWRRTADRLFAWFSAAFAMLAVERILLFCRVSAHADPTVYIVRLVAFLLIIPAVIDRNRRGAS